MLTLACSALNVREELEPNVRTLAAEFRARLRRVREGTMLTALTFAADHMMSLLAVGGGA